MEEFCEICGNDRIPRTLHCPHCGAKYRNHGKSKAQGHRVVNIEMGRPPLVTALQKLEREISRAREDKIAVVTIIHGYGASGRGGVIRQECRNTLDYMKDRKHIKEYIAGEHFTRKEGQTRALLRRLPHMVDDANLNRNNRGVTLVEL
ncbi:MAG: Smr/MutS family protein [Desulfopila sp.]